MESTTATPAPMTKARAMEIVYESLKKALMAEGIMNEEEQALLLSDCREDFGGILSDQEIIAFVEFLKNDVNQSLQMH